MGRKGQGVLYDEDGNLVHAGEFPGPRMSIDTEGCSDMFDALVAQTATGESVSSLVSARPSLGARESRMKLTESLYERYGGCRATASQGVYGRCQSSAPRKK